MNADQISFDDLAMPREDAPPEDDHEDTTISSLNLNGIWGLLNSTTNTSINVTAPTTSTGSITANPNGTYTYTVGGAVGGTVNGSGPSGVPGPTGVPGPNGVGTNTATKIAITNPPDDVFDLTELGVAAVGTFDSNGLPHNWNASLNPLPVHYPLFMHQQAVMEIDTAGDYRVYFRGIYSKKYTNERRAAMGLPPL